MALHDHTPDERRDLKQQAKQRPTKPFPKPPKSNSPVKFDLKGRPAGKKLRF